MATSFAMQTSCQAVFSTVIDGVLKPYDYTSKDTALVAVFFAGGGVVGAVGCAGVVDRTRKFNLILRSCAFISLIMTALMFITLPSGNVWLLGLNALIIGVPMFAVINTSYTYVVATT